MPLDPPDTIPHLDWLRQFAPATKSPTPENGDLVYENLTELVMWLGEMQDTMKVEPRIIGLTASVQAHNADVKMRCDRLRVEPVPCGGTVTTKCATCPKRRGLSIAIRIQP